jgi:hypothetical protein
LDECIVGGEGHVLIWFEGASDELEGDVAEGMREEMVRVEMRLNHSCHSFKVAVLRELYLEVKIPMINGARTLCDRLIESQSWERVEKEKEKER